MTDIVAAWWGAVEAVEIARRGTLGVVLAGGRDTRGVDIFEAAKAS